MGQNWIVCRLLMLRNPIPRLPMAHQEHEILAALKSEFRNTKPDFSSRSLVVKGAKPKMSRPKHITHPARITFRSAQPTSHRLGIGRRQFLAACATALAGGTAATLLGDDQRPLGKKAEQKTVEIDIRDGAALQSELDRHAGSGRRVRLKSAREITCLVQEQMIGGEKSIHPLLVPAGVHLDLQGSTLHLDCRSNSYGLRL